MGKHCTTAEFYSEQIFQQAGMIEDDSTHSHDNYVDKNVDLAGVTEKNATGTLP